jgi:hypothetical protein
MPLSTSGTASFSHGRRVLWTEDSAVQCTPVHDQARANAIKPLRHRCVGIRGDIGKMLCSAQNIAGRQRIA